GGTLSLPLPPGSSVTIQIQLGTPAVFVPILVTSSTQVEGATSLPATITDGDRVKVDAVIDGSVLRATKLEIEEFPEIEARGTVSGLPAAGVTLPLAPGTSIAVTLTLVPGVSVGVVLTSSTKVEDGPFTLTNGAVVQVEAVVRNNQRVVPEISAQGGNGEDGDDQGQDGDDQGQDGDNQGDQ